MRQTVVNILLLIFAALINGYFWTDKNVQDKNQCQLYILRNDRLTVKLEIVIN